MYMISFFQKNNKMKYFLVNKKKKEKQTKKERKVKVNIDDYVSGNLHLLCEFFRSKCDLFFFNFRIHLM